MQATAIDRCGYSTFAGGAEGDAHILSHRYLDSGQIERGYQELRARLPTAGTGSRYLHLEWHLLVFEVALGKLRDARRRFMKVILPAALSTDQVRTDAPSAMWRLALASRIDMELPWGAVHRATLHRGHGASAQVELYDLLLAAGAGDAAYLDRYVLFRERRFPRWDNSLDVLAYGFRELLVGESDAAARLFIRAQAELRPLFGSAAQRELLDQITSARDSLHWIRS